MSSRLLVTVGDPAGIGPEVSCRALAAIRGELGPVTLLGKWDAIAPHAYQAGLVVRRVADLNDTAGPEVPVYEPPEPGEPVEVAAVRAAATHLLAGHPGALVTGPIHKGRLTARGFKHPGHTELLGEICGIDRPVMAFVGGKLRVALVTVHVPLHAVPTAVTPERVLYTIATAHTALREQVGLESPRLLICGLNPHAGDDGAIGHEDQTAVAPAVAQAQALGIDAVGPVSAEAAFHMALQGEGDLVVAMYHDQGLVPLKAVDFGRSVNWTLGLPILRTSVDHGTADALVGTGRADPSSMMAAMRWADHLLMREHAGHQASASPSGSGHDGRPSTSPNTPDTAWSVAQSATSPSRS